MSAKHKRCLMKQTLYSAVIEHRKKMFHSPEAMFRMERFVLYISTPMPHPISFNNTTQSSILSNSTRIVSCLRVQKEDIECYWSRHSRRFDSIDQVLIRYYSDLPPFPQKAETTSSHHQYHHQQQYIWSCFTADYLERYNCEELGLIFTSLS